MSSLSPRFIELYRGELPYVVRTLVRLGVAKADIEDVAHDVFVTAFRRLDSLTDASGQRSWLFAIMFRTVGNYRRKSHRTREIHSDVDPVAPTLGPDGLAENARKRELVIAALASLDLEHRAVAILFDIEDKTAPEIAKALDLPLNAVYSRARNARKKMAQTINQLKGNKNE